MNRRDFLRTGAVGCGAHVLAQAIGAPAAARWRWTAPRDRVVAAAPFARLEQLGAGAWAVISTPLDGDRETFANGGLIAGSAGVVAIEGFYTATGATWLARESRRLTGRWPTHVVVTHYHVDHASGVAAYADAAGVPPQLHATAATRDLAVGGGRVAPRATDALRRAYADVVLVDTDGPTRLDLGDRVLTVHPRTGHTASDLVVTDDAAGHVFAGDLVWNGMFPNYVDARPAALREAVAWLGDRRPTRLVPGHGALADRGALGRYAALLDEIEAAARRAFERGIPAADAAAAYVLPPSLGPWLAGRTSIERAFAAWHRDLATAP